MLKHEINPRDAALLEILSGRARAETLHALTAADWAAMVELTGAKNLGPLLYHRIGQGGLEEAVPAVVRQQLRARYLTQAGLGVLYYGHVQSLLRALRGRDLPVIVLKGAHLARHVYENPALRAMADIDLLLRREDLSAAFRAATELGYRPARKIRIDRNFRRRHLPRMTKTDAFPVELHWRIDHAEEAKIPPDELWERAVETEYAGVPALSLAPEDLLLHLCEHTATQHAFEAGLRDLCDIDQTVRRHAATLDWPALAARAERWQMKTAAWLALDFAASLLKTPIPEEPLASLRPRRLDEESLTWLHDRFFAVTDGFIAPGFSDLMSRKGIKGKIRTLGRRLFPSRREMAGAYPVTESSPLLALYYPVRWAELLRRYAPTLWRTFRGDPRAKIQAENQARRTRLRKWLQEP